MVNSSSSASGQMAVATPVIRRLLDPLVKFLIRRRILLSAILFAVVVGKDVGSGIKPRDLVNFGDLYGVLGCLLVLAGLGLRSWSAGILHKNSQLTTTGPYSLIRNPLYVGSFLMMFGFCVLLGNPRNVWFIVGPLLLLYVVKVRQEERLMSTLFPEQWPAYFQRTPRFFPRLARTDLKANWRASQWMRSREYQALGATAVALVAMKMWHAFG